MDTILLSREALLAVASEPRRIEPVDLPRGRIFVRAMDAGERDRFDQEHLKDPLNDFRARMIAASACDAEGKRIFEAEDVPVLTSLPSHEIERLAEAAVRINRMTDADVEALRKNSPGPTGDSFSG